VGLVKEGEDSSFGFGSSMFDQDKDTKKEPEVHLTGHNGNINSIKISSDGSKMVSTSDDYTFALWDLKAHTKIYSVSRPDAPERAFKSADISADGAQILTACDDGEVSLWDLRSRKLIKLVTKHAGPVTTCAFGIGSTIISAGWDKTVSIYDGGRVRVVEHAHEDWILAADISSDGNQIVSGGWDDTVVLRDVKNLSTLATWAGHTGPVTSVKFAPDLRLIASASYDATVKLWNKTSGLEKTLVGHVGHVNCLAFGPKPDMTLISAGSDHSVKVWDMNRGVFTNEFVCQGPATSCDIKRAGNQGLLMGYGDSIGNIYLAKLETGGYY
jgi:WD40 repeat protein